MEYFAFVNTPVVLRHISVMSDSDSSSSAGSLRAIAREAGVSRMTVSRILNGRGGHRAEVVYKVKQAAERVGYRINPHVAAAMEQVRRTQPAQYLETLAFLHKGSLQEVLRSRHGAGVYQGIQERAGELGYQIEPHPYPESREDARRLRGILQARGIRGLILGTINTPGPLLYMDLSPFAAAAIGFTITRPSLVRVTSDPFLRSELALQKCLSRGYDRLAGIFEPGGDAPTGYRLLAPFLIQEKLSQLQGSTTQISVHLLELGVSEEDLDRQLAQFLKVSRPQVVISARRAIFHSLNRLGLLDEIRFLHLNWTEEGSRPLGLVGVDQQSPAQGRAAVDAVSARLHSGERGPAQEPRDLHVPPSWCGKLDAPAVAG